MTSHRYRLYDEKHQVNTDVQKGAARMAETETKTSREDWASAYGFETDKLKFTLDGNLPHYVFNVRIKVTKDNTRVSVYRKVVQPVLEDGKQAIALMAHGSIRTGYDPAGCVVDPPLVVLEYGMSMGPDRGLVLGELLQVTCREAKKAHATMLSAMRLRLSGE